MPQITKPNGALLGLGVLFLLTGFGFLYKAISPPPIPNCEGAQGYYLDKNLPEVTIALRPDCWSGEVRGYRVIYWLVDNTQPYEVIYGDGHVEELNRFDGRKIVPERGFLTGQRPLPVRFKGTGRVKISDDYFEGSLGSHERTYTNGSER
jgi:hypothetical protein